MGRLSRIEHPLFCRLALAVWQWFGGDLRLHEARRTQFASVHDCFIRELKEGVRPIDSDPDALVSPCDGIVMARGRIDDDLLIQAKGLSYTLDDLLLHPDLVARHRQGAYVTLRLTSTMYHRFHAPDAGEIDEVTYVAGDTWNVNGPAVARIPALYCRNERVILPMRLASGELLTLVPVAAILVGSIHLHFPDVLLNLDYRGPNRISCRGACRRGEELGYFHHGSTIVVLASGPIDVCRDVREGSVVRMGQPLLIRNRSNYAAQTSSIRDA